MRLRAHFDGKVIVPEEPLDLPMHSALEIKVRRVPVGNRKPFKTRHGIPLSRNDGVKMTADEVAAMLHDA